jgi:hypothetical protein
MNGTSNHQHDQTNVKPAEALAAKMQKVLDLWPNCEEWSGENANSEERT